MCGLRAHGALVFGAGLRVREADWQELKTLKYGGWHLYCCRDLGLDELMYCYVTVRWKVLCVGNGLTSRWSFLEQFRYVDHLQLGCASSRSYRN